MGVKGAPVSFLSCQDWFQAAPPNEKNGGGGGGRREETTPDRVLTDEKDRCCDLNTKMEEGSFRGGKNF